jgi:transcriptional regulator with XRE-family HTH domain
MGEENEFRYMLVSLRKRKGWTQADAAAHLGKGFSRHILSDLETGKSLPSQKQLLRIAYKFGLYQEEKDTLYRAAAHSSPEIDNLPPQNDLFTGRTAQLEQLVQLLKESTRPVCISGLPGIGKTQLALEYAHRCYQEGSYRTVLCVNAADETALVRSYDDLAHLLELPDLDERDLNQSVRAVKQWLKRHTNWLLIMDNADDLELARSFFPSRRQGHILLTTRSQFARKIGARQIVLDKMEPEEGMLFLLRRSKVLEDDEVLKDETKLDTVAADIREPALKLVELLDGHPLALDQAGAYIEETPVSLTDYINLYHEKRRDLLNSRDALDDEHEGKYSDHPESVLVTFELCFQKARERHHLADDILNFCAFLQPDAIPEELFQQDASFKVDALAFNKGIAALQRYSLINRNTQAQTLSLHRLVQAVLIDFMPPDLQKQWQVRAWLSVNAAFPEADFRNWSQCERFLPQVSSCVQWAQDAIPVKLFAAICLQAADECLQLRQYSDAELLFIAHPLLGFVMYLHKEERDHAQAVFFFQRLRNIFEQRLGPTHPLIGQLIIAYGTFLQDMERDS